MNVLNSSSSIISSFQVGTRSFPSFVSVMAGEGASPMNPEQVAPTEAPNVTAPPAGTTPVPDQVNPFAEIMAKAEKQSLEKTLNELLTVVASEKATIPKDLQVTDEEIDNMGPEEVSKLSCKCLVRSQTYLYGQVASNRGSLQLIVVAVKFLQAMAAQMEVTFENVKDNIKIGTEGVDSSLTAFAEAFGNFINTMKDLLAGIRASSSERKALQEGFNKTLQQLEEYCKHVRGNTNDLKGSASQIKNAATNIQWELSELRTGGKTASSGAVDSNGGSMLAAIGVAIQNEATNLLEGFNKIALNLQSELGKSIQESVERGTDPEKSLKRKYEDEQQAEFQRQKEELEQAKLLKQQQERREQVFHPSTGQVMYLTEGERRELYKSLHLMKEGDVPMAAGYQTSPAAPAHPPAMPSVGSFHPGFPHPFAPAPGFPPNPGCGPATGYGPPPTPVAPATLPVIGSHPGPGKSA